MAERFAIRNLDQAKRYLADPILGDRLRHSVDLMLRHSGKSATDRLVAVLMPVHRLYWKLLAMGPIPRSMDQRLLLMSLAPTIFDVEQWW